MIITCANCDTSYELNENLIKATGSKVRCKNCSHVFTVYPPQILDSIEPEPEIELEMVVEEPVPATEPEPSISMEAGISEDSDDSLNFPDLEKMLEAQGEEEPETVAITDDEPELDLDLDSGETQKEPAGAADTDLDFLDLSEIEDMLVSGVDAVPDSAKAGADEPELSLDMETKAPESTEEVAAGETGGIDLSEIEEMLDVDAALDVDDLEIVGDEDLTLDLEQEFSNLADIPKEDMVADEDSLDLSDIEKMLDSATTAGPASVKITGEEPELSLQGGGEEEVISDISLDDEGESLELDLELESPEEEIGDLKLELDDSEDLDLALEPEETLELEKDETPEIKEDDFKLEMEGELELELDMDEETLSLEPEETDSLELELDELEAAAPDTSDEGFELDLEELDEAEETAQAAVAAPPAKAKTPAAPGAFALGDEAVMKKAGEPARAKGKPVPKAEKKSRALTYILLILLILVGGAYGALTYLKQQGVEITDLPYIKTLFAKPGEVVALDYTLKYDFYENAKAGSLLVITGDVENKFDHGRSFIKVTGEVLSSSQKVIKSETVYCGNIIDKADLENEDLAVIKKHLQKQFGDKNANVNVKAGAKARFMVVFSNLPENVREFRVKVAGSEPAIKN